MSWSSSFDAHVDDGCRVLILGSMPGVKSLEEAEYYAHPRNAFWQIIETLFSIKRELPYQQRLKMLKGKGIALWDVYARCYRQGSLDADIDKGSAIFNDFASLFKSFPNIQYVFFNGKAAEHAYQKMLKIVDLEHAVNYMGLPSTSPANAAMNFGQKLEQWQQVKVVLEKAQ